MLFLLLYFSFTPDCQHLISASGDGCIFIWKVPHDMVVTMRARLAQQAIRLKRLIFECRT